MTKKHKMGTYYQLVTSGVHTETWSFVNSADDYSKYITEGVIDVNKPDAYLIFENTFTENQVKQLGATEISDTDFNTYFSRIGSHPPQKP